MSVLFNASPWLEEFLGNCRQLRDGAAFDYEREVQPEVIWWMESNRERALQLDAEELDELLSLHGTGGPLTPEGVETACRTIELRRELLYRCSTIFGTDMAETFKGIVDIFFLHIQPYREGGSGRPPNWEDMKKQGQAGGRSRE